MNHATQLAPNFLQITAYSDQNNIAIIFLALHIVTLSLFSSGGRSAYIIYMSLSKFVTKCKDYLIEQRNNIYVNL